MNGPDSTPGMAEQIAERNELIRQAAERAVRAADNGGPHDPVYIAWARQFCRQVQPLGRALGTGDPR